MAAQYCIPLAPLESPPGSTAFGTHANFTASDIQGSLGLSAQALSSHNRQQLDTFPASGLRGLIPDEAEVMLKERVWVELNKDCLEALAGELPFIFLGCPRSSSLFLTVRCWDVKYSIVEPFAL